MEGLLYNLFGVALFSIPSLAPHKREDTAGSGFLGGATHLTPPPFRALGARPPYGEGDPGKSFSAI